MRDRAEQKNPWLAVNLSMLLPGLGQFYGGSWLGGCFFVLALAAAVAAQIWLIFGPSGGLWVIPLAILAPMVVNALSQVHAYFVVRRRNSAEAAAAEAAVPPAGPPTAEPLTTEPPGAEPAAPAPPLPPVKTKNPYVAMFLSRLLPGLGHAYIGKWGHAVAAIALPVVLFAVPAETRMLHYALMAATWAWWVLAVYTSAAGACKGAGGPPPPVKLLTAAVAAKEPVLVALLLLARVWAVEAFYVRSGAMAPAIRGEHVEVQCELCGLRTHTSPQRPDECPNCGKMLLVKGRKEIREGDRIVAFKLLDLVELRPWDVIVFRNPQNLRENYVMRLIGLPGESIEIILGDVFYRSESSAPWRIRRKPPGLQEAVWQLLCDQDYLPRHGLPRSRWQAGGDWQKVDEGRSFRLPGGAKESLLSFEAHRGIFLPGSKFSAVCEDDVCGDVKLSLEWTPNAGGWVRLVLAPADKEFVAELGHDGRATLGWRATSPVRPPLDAPCVELPASREHDHVPGGSDRLEGGQEQPIQQWATAQVGPVRAGRAVRLELAHADYRVTFQVDGRVVLESSDQQYSPDADALRRRMLDEGVNRGRQWLRPLSIEQRRYWLNRFHPALAARYLPQMTSQAARVLEEHPKTLQGLLDNSAQLQWEEMIDASPERASPRRPGPRLAVEAAGGGVARHVRVFRDVYYTCPELMGDRWRQEEAGEYARRLGVADGMPGWGTTGNPMRLARNPQRSELDEFFVLGDNSAASLDGRLWTRADPSLKLYDEQGRPIYTLGTVPRYCLIGKATKRYWPPERIGPLP